MGSSKPPAAPCPLHSAPREGPSPTAIVRCCWAPSRGLCPAPCTPAVPQRHPNIQANPTNKQPPTGQVLSRVETPGSSGPTWKPRPERAHEPDLVPHGGATDLQPRSAPLEGVTRQHLLLCGPSGPVWGQGRGEGSTRAAGERAPWGRPSAAQRTQHGPAARPWASHMTWCVLSPLEPSRGRWGGGGELVPCTHLPHCRPTAGAVDLEARGRQTLKVTGTAPDAQRGLCDPHTAVR